jgi:hypothetical protein
MLPLVYAAATVPFGVLLAVARRSLSVARIALAGFLMISAATTMSMLLLDSTPSLAGLACRTGGIAIGGALARRLAAADAGRWRPRLARLVPWLTAPYLIAVLYAKNLLSSHWRTLPEALAAFDSHGLLPFYHHYIVTKAHAARSVAFELICFGPIGVMAALRRSGGRGTLWLAASLAFLLSFAIEFARWFKPGLQPDFSNPIIAAIGAALAAALTPIFWQALTTKPIPATGVGAPEGGARTWQLSSEVFVRDRRQSHPFPFRAVLALAVSLGCLAAAGMIAAAYPLAPWLIGSVLALYAAALWRWPSLWLAVLPAVLPALDLAPWTGWVYVGEADLFALVTIGILALRAPPRAADFRFRGLAVAALMLAVLSCLAGMALGLAMPGPAGGSDNPYLRPDNALRVAKGFLTALALLPFLRERLRRSSDALSWLGAGITTGLAVVAVAAIAERSLFPGLIDFSAEYRISATFSSMGFGGGYVGAYIALALPFLLVCLVRPRLPTLIAMALVALGAGYALIVTFARAAYAASLLSVVVACLGWGWAARRGRAPPLPSLTLPALFLAMVGVIVAAGIATPAMSRRVEQTSVDLAGRETSWTQGLALRDRGLLAALYGMGLGTYPRVVLAHKLDGRFPTNFVVGRDGGYGFLSLFAGMPLYFGQIVPIEPGRTYRLFLGLRSPAGKGALSVLLCEKWLMYSDNCRRLTVVPRTTGQWEDFGAVIASKELGRPALFGWLRRPVDISLFDPVPGTAIDIGHVRMLDARGHDLLANGDFSRGTERWYFTDDDHLMWRIENQYLMTLIESGVLGLAALILLAAAAMLGAIRGIRFGVPMAACIAGSLAGFLFCCLFDCLLDAPRLATLFYLIAFSGLAMLSHAPSREPSVGSG